VRLRAREWELSTALLRTRTEQDAISFRAIRRLEIKALLLECE